MPAKGKGRITNEQRKRIAAGKLLRKTSRQIAQETGLAKSTVDHQASDPRTATLTLALKHRHRDKIEEAYKLSLKSILTHLKSKSTDLIIDARRDLFRMLPLGDPPLLRIAPAYNSGGDFTLEDLLISYRKASEPQKAEEKQR